MRKGSRRVPGLALLLGALLAALPGEATSSLREQSGSSSSGVSSARDSNERRQKARDEAPGERETQPEKASPKKKETDKAKETEEHSSTKRSSDLASPTAKSPLALVGQPPAEIGERCEQCCPAIEDQMSKGKVELCRMACAHSLMGDLATRKRLFPRKPQSTAKAVKDYDPYQLKEKKKEEMIGCPDLSIRGPHSVGSPPSFP